MAITALAGLILGSPTLRLRGDYLAIVTLGFGEIIRLLADNLDDITNGPRGLNEVAYPAVRAERTAARRRLLQRATRWATPTTAPGGSGWVIVLIVVMLLFVGNLERSRVGRAWVAIREDEDAAEVMGVNTFKFKLWAFVIGAAIGGCPVRSTPARCSSSRRRRSTSSTRCCSCAPWCSAGRATSWA